MERGQSEADGVSVKPWKLSSTGVGLIDSESRNF